MVRKTQSDMPEILFCCSYFDLMDGPKQIATFPPYNGKNKILISEFFDFHNSGDFFTHIFNNQISFNKLYKIKRTEVRGGHRQYMITALVSMNLLRKKDLLSYYTSFNQIFDSWADSFSQVKEINSCIIDGEEIEYKKIIPIINQMKTYREEFEYILSTMPEVISVPLNKLY